MNADELKQQPVVASVLADANQLGAHVSVSVNLAGGVSRCESAGHRRWRVFVENAPPEPFAVHEILHAVLFTERFPNLRVTRHNTVKKSRFGKSFSDPSRLADLVNAIHHMEIYRRMEHQYGINMATYYTAVLKGRGQPTLCIEQVPHSGADLLLNWQRSFFHLFDNLLMRPFSDPILARYQSNDNSAYNAAIKACEAAHAIGCSTPEAALDTARLLTRSVFRFGLNKSHQSENDLWQCLEWYLPVNR